jgi:cell volume regulation protein A
LTVFFVAAAVMIIGFLANILFKKTGWPEILFLIFIGIILGPVLNVFLESDLLPILPLVSTFTLLMVLFRGGLELNLSEIAAGSFRSIFQTLTYFAAGTILITLFTHFIIGWSLIDGLLLGSMISQIGEVVIIPMVKKLGLQNQSATLLSIESVMSSIVCIVFFFAFLASKTGDGTFNPMDVLTSIVTKFAVGIIVGVIMALPWLRVLFALEKNELTYIATLGYVLACYAISETLLGSGALSVLAFGVILGNYTQVLGLLRMKQPSASFSKVTEYLTRFQTELSFILRAFFFVLLGIIFEVSTSSIVAGLSLGLPIVAILLGARYMAVSASTWRSPMVSEKKIIVGLCAHGLTPALLSFIVLQYNFPNAYLFPLIVTSVIIMTNIIASVASFMYKRTKSHDQATVSIALGNEPVSDSEL